MSTLIRLYEDSPQFLALLTSGAQNLNARPAPTASGEIDSAIDQILARGIDSISAAPVVAVFAMDILCARHLPLAGDLDHFQYEKEEFPELWALQFGDGKSSLSLPVDDAIDIPCVNHFSAGATVTLLRALEENPASDRPAYCLAVYLQLSEILGSAAQRGHGIFTFTG